MWQTAANSDLILKICSWNASLLWHLFVINHWNILTNLTGTGGPWLSNSHGWDSLQQTLYERAQSVLNTSTFTWKTAEKSDCFSPQSRTRDQKLTSNARTGAVGCHTPLQKALEQLLSPTSRCSSQAEMRERNYWDKTEMGQDVSRQLGWTQQKSDIGNQG